MSDDPALRPFLDAVDATIAALAREADVPVWLLLGHPAPPDHGRTPDGAYVVTDLPDPAPWIDPALWDTRARQQDAVEAHLLARHRHAP